ncbi:MAG: sulfurtransferase TusA family protein [Burkholderiales bacterium]|jgi:sulfite reductase (ferredoxin)|nr:sulfurtransferase TusA family protein [Burkholderiales bacterium]
MTGYAIPKEVHEDFNTFSKQYRDFAQGSLDAVAFKTYRVPFGIYEQRDPDTYMVRVKLAGGLISPAQLRVLGELAQRYGDKRVHVTTRAGAQIHQVSHPQLLTIIDALHQVGLTGRGGGGNTVRNIMADFDAGVSQHEVFDTTPHAVALTEAMLSLKDSYQLPRKYKIVFSGSTQDLSGASFSDVGFIAKIKDGKRGFGVWIAGGMGAKSRLSDLLIDFLPEEDIYCVAQAIKELFNEKGNRKNKHHARLRFLVEDLGFDTFKALVREKMSALRAQGLKPLTLSPLSEVTPLADDALPPLNEEERLWWNRYVIPQKQKGYYLVKLPLSLGDIHADFAVQLADQLAKLTDHHDVIRFAADQNAYLRNLTASSVMALYPLIRQLAPLSVKAPVIGNIVVCTGAATCQLGVTIPRGALKPIEKALTQSDLALDALSDIKIHLSGCPNSCGKHAIADLGFFGKLLRKNGVPYPAYNVLVGAKTGENNTRFARKVADISAFHLPQFVVEVMKSWLSVKPGYRTFSDWIDDTGEQTVKAVADQLSDIPDFDDDKNPYFDYSAKTLFSIKGRGTGECSAGMYDLIEADKKALTELLNAPQDETALRTIRLLAARMLLVTQGDDSRQEEAVLKAFRLYFIDKGYIGTQYIDELNGAPTAKVIDLAREVIALYQTMDHTLSFAVNRPSTGEGQARSAEIENSKDQPNKGEASTLGVKAQPLATPPVNRFKDYRGVACPMNFVKTKLDLAQMKSGELLEIVLDDGAPIDNVPQSVANEGHAILSQDKVGDVWHVKIRKK